MTELDSLCPAKPDLNSFDGQMTNFSPVWTKFPPTSLCDLFLGYFRYCDGVMVAQKCPAGSRYLEIQLAGGLGNQLFQLAYGISLSLNLNSHIRFLNPVQGRSFALEWLGISTISAQFFSLLDQSLEVFTFTGCTCNINAEYSEPSFISTPKTSFDVNTKLIGYFQSELFFIQHKEIIRTFFYERLILITNDTPTEKYAIDLHVRLGDFIRSRKAKRFHGLITDEYVANGLNQLGYFSNPLSLRIITDDPESLDEALPDSVRFASEVVSSQSALLDLRILTEAEKLIISNSTFSWWGAYLSSAEVIAPIKWFAGEYSSLKLDQFLYPHTWSVL